MKLELEQWASTHNRQEKHFFIHDGKQHGYQEAEYAFGINPRYFDESMIESIKAMLEPVYRRVNFGKLD